MVAKQRIQDEQDRDIVQAWHTANLTRAEKLPPLKTLLTGRVATSSEPTVDKHRVMLQQLSEHIGVPIRPRRPRQEQPHG